MKSGNVKRQWDPEGYTHTVQTVGQRIKTCISYRGWQHVMSLIDKMDCAIDELKVAEVGCGTGTMSLTLALLGADVVLFDFNDKVLENTRRIYELYDCKAQFIKASCLEAPPEELTESFDIVISGGLAEHFRGSDRETCIAYHKLLLKKEGIAYIGVPNRFSPFYHWVRSLRKLTGTWKISVEIPFSDRELKRTAGKIGFSDSYVIGSAPLRKDFITYSLGVAAALKEVLPKSIREFIDEMKNASSNKIETKSVDSSGRNLIINELHKMRSAGRENEVYPLTASMTNKFSSGLILFGFK